MFVCFYLLYSARNWMSGNSVTTKSLSLVANLTFLSLDVSCPVSLGRILHARGTRILHVALVYYTHVAHVLTALRLWREEGKIDNKSFSIDAETKLPAIYLRSLLSTLEFDLSKWCAPCWIIALNQDKWPTRCFNCLIISCHHFQISFLIALLKTCRILLSSDRTFKSEMFSRGFSNKT